MRNASLVLIVLVALGHGVHAQPGATEPMPQGTEPPPPSRDELIDNAVSFARANAPTIERVAMGALRRARRSISIGPTFGLWSAAFIDPRDVDAALSFGLGIEKFDVPVMPDIDTLKDLITERVKAQAKQRIAEVFRGVDPTPLQVNEIVMQVYEDVRKEILGLENVRPKTLERPSFTLGIEANRLFGADRWLGRARVGIGIWKLTLGVSAAVGRVCRGDGCNTDVKAFVGPEIVLHALTSDNPRANVVDGFVRFDRQVSGRADQMTYDQIVLGARFLLDAL